MVCRTAVTRSGTCGWAGLVLLAALSILRPGLLEAAMPDRLRVLAIAMAEQGGGARVELRLSRSSSYTLFTLTDPNRVVLDIPAAALGPSAMPLPAGTGPVLQIRAAHRPDGSLRLVFDGSVALQPTATLLADGGLPLLTLTLQAPAVGSVAPSPASPAAIVAAQPPAAPAVTAAAVDAEAPAAGPAVTPARTSQRQPDVVVVVDAGHGGHDPGAHGPSGVREKDVTLAISRQLVTLLNAEPGMRGVLTRSDDRFLGLRERMERARSANAHLFISIHADAAANRNAQGSTVYALSGKAASDEASRRLAARENAALIGGVDLGDKDPVLASVLMDLSQNASISSSIAVGGSILDRMSRLGPLHRASVQQAPFMVLKSPDVPSVLIETAYISNPVDEQNLSSAPHQEALARAILDGVRNYFAANPPGNPVSRPPTTVAASGSTATPADGPARPRQHVIRRGDTLSGVASLYSVSLRSLRTANRLSSDTVRVGQTLRIPSERT